MSTKSENPDEQSVDGNSSVEPRIPQMDESSLIEEPAFRIDPDAVGESRPVDYIDLGKKGAIGVGLLAALGLTLWGVSRFVMPTVESSTHDPLSRRNTVANPLDQPTNVAGTSRPPADKSEFKPVVITSNDNDSPGVTDPPPSTADPAPNGTEPTEKPAPPIDETPEKTGPEWALINEAVGHQGAVVTAVITPDGRFAVTGGFDKLRVWNLTSDREVLVFKEHGDLVWSVDVTSDSRLAVSGSSDNTVRVWELESGRQIHSMNRHSGGVTSVDISHDDLYIVSGGNDATIRVWDIKTGKHLSVLQGHTEPVTSVKFNKDRTKLFSSSIDRSMVRWDSQTGRIDKRYVTGNEEIYAIALSPDDSLLAATTGRGQLLIWSTESGTLKAKVLAHEESPTRAITFSHDGQYVVTGGQDGGLRMFDVQSGELKFDLGKYNNGIYSAAISPDGFHVVAGGGDKKVRHWKLVSGR